MTSFASHKYFLIVPKEGEIIQDASNEDNHVTLGELCVGINENSTQLQFLEKLGITFSAQNMNLTFKEKGNAYADPNGDRTKKEETPTTINFNLKLPLKSNFKAPIAIKISLDPFIEDGINFLGQVSFQTPDGIKRSIPMTGTGTVALEGHRCDCHAGFCTGPACASFQERVAIILGVCAAVGVQEENVELLCLRLKKVNEKYHGRGDVLDYVIERATTDRRLTYFEYMKSKYTDPESVPPMLQAFIEEKPPLEEYYEKLNQRFDPETISRQSDEWKDRQNTKESYFSTFTKSPYGALVVCGTVATAFCLYLFRRK